MDLSADFTRGRWWLRSWLDSLPVEKGGLPLPVLVDLGQEVEVVRFEDSSLTSSGRIRSGETAFYFRAIRGETPSRVDSAGITIATPAISGKSYDFNFSPTATFKLALDPREWVSSIRLQVRVRLFAKRKAWLLIAANGEWQPSARQGVVVFRLEWLVW